MIFSDSFIAATKEYNEFDKNVPAPYLRKNLILDKNSLKAEITVCGLGFYRIWINGIEVTKGMLAPYISNPDHILYYDNYDIAQFLQTGKNTFGFLLGNGLLNNPGGFVWDFDEAECRSAPKLAFSIEIINEYNEKFIYEADTDIKTCPSPIYFDDLRCGERYDARKEIFGWNLPDFDDSLWDNAIKADTPKGEKRICCADPIKPTGEVLKPVKIFYGELADYTPNYKKNIPTPFELPGTREGYIFDFGKNRAGIIKLKIKGYPGQRIEIQFAEYIDENGKLNYSNISFYPDGYSQRDVFICSGRDDEYVPSFTYHGFSCCLITGITEAQATEGLISYIICNSALEKTGNFCCSDKVANDIYEMTCASDMSNFYYFPTDCPHREKNGWTGDAALSAQHFFMNYSCFKSIDEWLNNIRKSQKPNGSLPGIIPDFDWGYDTGPSWDICLVEMPYRAYMYTGDKKILFDNSDCILKYIEYVFNSRKDERGLISFGLGDWCSVDWKQKASRDFTCSVTVLDLCRKASFIFGVIGQDDKKQYASECASSILNAIRINLVSLDNFTADTRCQTSQAMAIYYNVFKDTEKTAAVRVLVDIIHEDGDFIDMGILGARVLFHVLSSNGYSDLAYKMLFRPEWPSYGHFIEQGLTALSEEFIRDDGKWDSRNHHMFGDVSNWLISKVAGLSYNPNADDLKKLNITPSFISKLNNAEAEYKSIFGKITIKWIRSHDIIKLYSEYPVEICSSLIIVPQEQDDGRHIYRVINSSQSIENDRHINEYEITDILIRPIKQRDKKEMQSFFDRMSDASTKFFNVDHGNEKRVMEYFENGKTDQNFYIACCNEKIIALAFTWDNDKKIPWMGIAVDDTWHGKGIGTDLLNYVIDRSLKKGCGGLILRTAIDNLKARRLYEKNGFENIGVHSSGELLYLKRFCFGE